MSQLEQVKQEIAKNNPNPSKLKNPAELFIEWKPGKGEFVYYDKEKQTNVVVGESIECVVFSQLYTLRGFTPTGNGLVSNEVANPGKQDFYVREYFTDSTGNKASKIVASGNWKKEIKGNCPVKFYMSLYGVALINNEARLVNIRIGGAGLSAVIQARLRPEEGFCITFKKGQEQKNGMIVFHELDITQSVDVPQTIENNLFQPYQTLNTYLNQYFKANDNDIVDQVFDADELEAEEPAIN